MAQTQAKAKQRLLRFTVGANIGTGNGKRYEPGDTVDADDVPPGPRKSWLAEGVLVEVKATKGGDA